MLVRCLDNTSLAGTPVNKGALEDLVKCGVFFVLFVYTETRGSESERNTRNYHDSLKHPLPLNAACLTTPRPYFFACLTTPPPSFKRRGVWRGAWRGVRLLF